MARVRTAVPTATLAFALALALVLGLVPVSGRAADAAGAGDSHAAIEAAARAMGGIERVRAVKNITLIGYGQYAYQFGAGNVSAAPHAAERFMAANDLRRVYDLESGRFQQTERRNMLFTFALRSLTSWQPFNLVLDGDLAWDVAPDGKATRIPRWTATAWQVDGVHMRRMWKMNNPVVLVRAALDPATRLGKLREERGLNVIDLTLPEGDKLSLALDPKSRLPAFVRWTNPHNNFGQLTFTTWLEAWTPFDGLLLPLSYDTMIDWRDIDYLKVYVDGYAIDGKLPDLAAPASVRAAPEPQEVLPPVIATPIAKGIWYLKAKTQGSTVFEFDDHLAIFEINSKSMAKAIIDKARSLVPGKPLTQLITSHAHPDHVEGIRVAVAEGLAVISRRGNEQVIRDMVTHPSPDYPDALTRNPQPLKFLPVDEHLRLADRSMTVDVYWARTNSHMADGLFAYAPEAKVMAEADIATAAQEYQYWADNYMDVLEYYKLDVQTLLPVHEPPMKQAEVIEYIKGGVQRARARCAEEEAKGNPHIGCPVLTRRY
jgi:glyoxylase-like metal-dependent hydrolase (beta-lactamase superfamily II)